MAKCDHCGNDYHNPMTIERGGQRYTFDSFECAIQHAAPRCGTCNVPIIGHGRETEDGRVFCCSHCGRRAGADLAH